MGKRKRNVVTKFERNAQSLLRTSDFQNLSRLSKEYNSVPGEWQTTIIEVILTRHFRTAFVS